MTQGIVAKAKSNRIGESQVAFVPRLREVIRQAWRMSPLLALSGLVNAALIPVFGLALIADPSVITGSPAWLKPLKFAISIALYSFSFLWILRFVQGMETWKRWLAGITGGALLLEQGLIAMQVIRGTTSHFNFSSVFNAVVYQVMGASITAVAVVNLIVAVWLLRQRLKDPVFAWSLRLGLLVSLIGMLVAFLMTSPTADQLAQLEQGAGSSIIGAHAVGVADGGEGLPLVGWSTVGGDLRIPHFVGLHAMQVLPLIGFLLSRERFKERWSQLKRTALMILSGLSYLGLVVLQTWQALRGQPLLKPDGTTMAAGLGLLATIALSVSLVAWLGGSGQKQSKGQQELEVL